MLIKGLPEENKTTVLFLIEFLSLIAKQEEINKMSSANLAMIFAPNLFRDKEKPGANNLGLQMMSYGSYVTNVIRQMIDEVDYITCKTDQPLAAADSANENPIQMSPETINITENTTEQKEESKDESTTEKIEESKEESKDESTAEATEESKDDKKDGSKDENKESKDEVKENLTEDSTVKTKERKKSVDKEKSGGRKKSVDNGKSGEDGKKERKKSVDNGKKERKKSVDNEKSVNFKLSNSTDNAKSVDSNPSDSNQKDSNETNTTENIDIPLSLIHI
eukprot:TRINITY_DN4981_c0_g2_i1.p1 TRINITY_DN4981_c0_g2~~TRINITY_DN4981_c0_g2_i1.p1  ORF type:complete len:287 (-),score=88.25 TRINITY_DN4981_c0_g2_i1:8-844(-)